MKAHLILNWQELGTKYWLIPSLMALGAVVLSLAIVSLDRWLADKWIESFVWLHGNQPSGARALLSTIAGSMITVAGVTFSITTAAVATTASSFGPRLVSNFMSDRGNQITLGTFIATFLFCTLVLRTVRGEDGAADSFVPHAAILFALLLAVASLGVLIYFIHHVPESIHISNIVARIGRDLKARVEELFPEQLGESSEEDGREVLTGGPPQVGTACAPTSGYIRYIDQDGLMALASEHDLIVHLQRRPGDFVTAGQPLLSVFASAPVDPAGLDRLQETFVIGGYRSQEQDIVFVVNRLVEVAARALSPGMNDIFTATNAMDWLGGGLSILAQRRTPDAGRRDSSGVVRVVAPPKSFEEVADAIFDQLRPYAASDRNAAVHLMQVLAEAAADTHDRGRRAVLLRHATALHDAGVEALTRPRDRAALDEIFETARRRLGIPRDSARASA